MSEQRRVLQVTCLTHAVHDGLMDLLYIMLPLWQTQFSMSYAAMGMLRALYTGTMAVFQVPAASLSPRFSGGSLLCLGTLLAAAGFAVAGLAGGVVSLALGLLLGGLGASVQHPIASSIVASAYEGPASRSAISHYNFAGDVGKMIIPLLVSCLLTVYTRQTALLTVAAIATVSAIAVFRLLPNVSTAPKDRDKSRVGGGEAGSWGGFIPMVGVAILDSAVRMGFLTFLPIALHAKGAAQSTIGWSLTLLFAGGACGKLVCGYLGTRLGVLRTVWLTEGCTAALIAATIVLPLAPALVLLPLLGVALNGTSSVLYGAVPELSPRASREKAFGIFYTAVIGSGALSPILFGAIGDRLGLPLSMAVLATVGLGTLPLAWQACRRLKPGL